MRVVVDLRELAFPLNFINLNLMPTFLTKA